MNKENKINQFLKSFREKITNNKKKNLIFLVGLVIFIVVLVLIVSLFSNKKDERLLEIFDENRPILFEASGKFGYIDPKGEVLIDAEYEAASEFYYGYAGVKKSDQGDDAGWNIINLEKKEILTSNDEPKFYFDGDVWLIDNELYDKDINKIFGGDNFISHISNGFFEYLNNEEQEAGIIDSKGNVIFSWNHDYITATISKNSNSKDFYAVISNFEEDENVVSLQSGKNLIKLEDPKNKYIRENDENIFRVINREEGYKTEKWYYIKNDKILFETDENIYNLELANYDDEVLKIDYGPNYQDLGYDSQYTYYFIKTKEYSAKYVEADESFIKDTKYKISTCSKNKKALYKKNKELTSCKYDGVKTLNADLFFYLLENEKKDLILLTENNETILYNMRSKKEITKFDTTSVYDSENSTFLNAIIYEDNGYTKKEYVIYNLVTDKSIKVDPTSEVVMGSNFVRVETDSKIVIYNMSLNDIYNEQK